MTKAVLAEGDLERIADACKVIANEAADEWGFVSMRCLLARFQARLLIQPMLVEGMLAKIRQANEITPDGGAWAVLVDSESYEVQEQDIQSESRLRPLPYRLRNTIAHELVHSLAFRPTEFGISLKLASGRNHNPDDLVCAIERETEKLSPLLLCSDKALARLFRSKEEALSIDELTEARRSLAVSRYVLINRLCLLQEVDKRGFLSLPALQNLAVGIGEWRDGGTTVVRSWPIFANFERNLLPVFVREISQQDRSPATSIFRQQTFVMCGGSSYHVEVTTPVGTAANPRIRNLEVQLSAETGSRKPGSEFLFSVRGARC